MINRNRILHFYLIAFFVISCCLLVSCSSLAAKQVLKKVPDLKKLWGTEFYLAVKTPERVRAFPVNPDKSAPGETRILGFAVGDAGMDLPQNLQKALSDAFLDTKTYNFLLAKRGPLFPEFGFRFDKAEKNFWVLFDRSRMEVAFFDGQKQVMYEDCDSIRDLLKSITDLLEANGGNHE